MITPGHSVNQQALHVLDFWFGNAVEPRAEWFRKDDAFDTQIRQRFGATLDAALSGALDAWHTESNPAALARVVVLDQFTRNAFRDTARAFAGDAQALAAARHMVLHGRDQQLDPLHRLFVYLPFEHSESLVDQHECLRLMEQLAQDDARMADYPRWARSHLDIVERFGRFPHRNAALGRASTAEEMAFLMQPGSSF